MKILVYNWVQFDDSKNRGGGVSVYLSSLLKSMLSAGHELVFLSSGCHYGLLRRKPYLQETSNALEHLGLKSYQIINSPVKGPSGDSFYAIKESLDNPDFEDFLIDIINMFGPLDQIHFHGIEGLSTGIFERFNTPVSPHIVVWFHNYHWVCRQIELLFGNKSRCDDYQRGASCISCPTTHRDMYSKMTVQRMVDVVDKLQTRFPIFGAQLDTLVRKAFVLGRTTFSAVRGESKRAAEIEQQGLEEQDLVQRQLAIKAERQYFEDWRLQNIDSIETNIDQCITVSHIAKRTLMEMGVTNSSFEVVPIGMDVFNPSFSELGLDKAKSIDGLLNVAYLGYPTVSKGFDLFCDTLALYGDDLASSISVKIVSKLTKDQIEIMAGKLHKYKVERLNGYVRNEMSKAVEDVDIAIIPSVWNETFNQVAYELIMLGVPVIVSDSAGISSYLPKMFVFESGNSESLRGIIQSILSDPEKLQKYWLSNFDLISFEAHYEHLDSVLFTAQ